MPREIFLNDIAYSRSGDKGDVCNVGVIAKKPEYYDLIKRQLTPERIKRHFGDMVKGDVECYPMDNIESILCVLRRALGGGATRTLKFDQTGKSMCCAMLRMKVQIPTDLKV